MVRASSTKLVCIARLLALSDARTLAMRYSTALRYQRCSLTCSEISAWLCADAPAANCGVGASPLATSALVSGVGRFFAAGGAAPSPGGEGGGEPDSASSAISISLRGACFLGGAAVGIAEPEESAGAGTSSSE